MSKRDIDDLIFLIVFSLVVGSMFVGLTWPQRYEGKVAEKWVIPASTEMRHFRGNLYQEVYHPPEWIVLMEDGTKASVTEEQYKKCEVGQFSRSLGLSHKLIR